MANFGDIPANTAGFANDMATQAELDAVSGSLAAHIADATDAHAASAITNTPAGSIAASTVQAALNELDTDKASNVDFLSLLNSYIDHVSNNTSDHEAFAIVFTPAGGIAAVDVQAAIEELAAEKANTASSFRAHKNAVDQTGIVPTVETKITFTTEQFDVGGYYDAPNSKWTPPAGKVWIGATVFFTVNLVDQAQITLVVYKNGAPAFYYLAGVSGTGSVQTASVVTIDDANGTDYYEVYATAAGAGNKTIDGRGILTWFFGYTLQ